MALITKEKAKTFTKKPVDIEAIQFYNWSTALDILAWGAPVFFVPRGYDHHSRPDSHHDRSNGHILEDAPPFLLVTTLEGQMKADVNDWIIKGIQGEFYPCKPDIFEATYDKKER